MTKTRITILTAILLVAVMLLSACSAGSTFKLKDSLDGSLYEETAVTATATLIPELQDANLVTHENTLLYFVTYVSTGAVIDKSPQRHIVYNLETGAVVFDELESDTVEYSVTLRSSYMLDENEGSFIYVQKTTYAAEGNSINYDDPAISTAIYNTDGSQIASAERDCGVTTSYDLIHFDGKCYRLGDDGKYAYAFDRSSLASFPYIVYSTEELYLSVTASTTSSYITKLCIYDKQLNLLSTYTFPSYMEMGSGAILENGNFLLQGTVELDALAEDYDVYADETKYDLVTFIIDLEKGESKEIDFEYTIEEFLSVTDEDREYAGLKGSIASFAVLHPIENKRINENISRIATIDNKGKPKFLEEFNGMNVEELELVATNRWYLCTDTGGAYIINEKAEILGDVTNAALFANYLACDAKLYDFDLNVILDYEAEKLTLSSTFDNALLFNNKDGELILFANGQKTTLIAKDSKREFLSLFECEGYFAIVDYSDELNSKTEIYNGAGSKILTLGEEGLTFGIKKISDIVDGSTLICVTSTDSETFEVVRNYYIVK